MHENLLGIRLILLSAVLENWLLFAAVKVNNWLRLSNFEMIPKSRSGHGDGQIIGNGEAIGAPEPSVIVVKRQVLAGSHEHNIDLKQELQSAPCFISVPE